MICRRATIYRKHSPQLRFLMYSSLDFDTYKLGQRSRWHRTERWGTSCVVRCRPIAKVEPFCVAAGAVTATISNLGDRHEKEDIRGRDECIVACNNLLGRRQRKG